MGNLFNSKIKSINRKLNRLEYLKNKFSKNTESKNNEDIGRILETLKNTKNKESAELLYEVVGKFSFTSKPRSKNNFFVQKLDSTYKEMEKELEEFSKLQNRLKEVTKNTSI